MRKIAVLILFLLSSASFAKEIMSSSVNTNLYVINVRSTSSLEEATYLPKILGQDYDVLTLKGKEFNQYLVNISQESVDKALNDAKQISHNAHISSKKNFLTSGVILLSEDNITNANDVIDNGNALTDINNSQIQYENNTSIQNIAIDQQSSLEKFLLKGDANSSTENPQEASSPSRDTQSIHQTKIDLIDAVLQTLSISNKAMSSREKMIQAKHNIDIAYGNYYPSIDTSYTLGKTDLRPGIKKTDQSREKAKYYGDEIYSLTLSQNVYAGGETENEIERLKAQYLIAKTDYEKLLEEEALKAINAYIDVVFTRDSLEVNQKNMEELETIFEIVKTKYDAGALSIGELSSIEASISNAKSQLSRTNSRYVNALEYFKFIAGETFTDTYPYEKVTHVHVEDFDKLYENALANNSKLRAYNYEILSSKFNLKKLKSAFRPKVNIVLGAEKVTDKEDFEVAEDSYYA
ncbi:MAG: TolC family protein, partial [Sulfurospirillaceae bacterium]|nr:TolC family protein [Sulfurospirillaceae bacterium]